MKIASWNINSVRLRMPLLQEFIMQEQPDVILLQETKTQDEFFPLDACKSLGYKHIHIRGQKSYNGVAILSKIPFERSWSHIFCNDDARHVAVRVQSIDIHNFYVPAGGDEPDVEINPKFAHKLQYLQEMQKLFSQHDVADTVIAGDFNIAPFEHDVWSSKQLRSVVSHTDIERSMLLELVDKGGFVDIARQFIAQEDKLYSWWSYRNRDWAKSNRGRRLDHIWCTQNLLTRVSQFDILRQMRGSEKPSDHVPVMIVLDL